MTTSDTPGKTPQEILRNLVRDILGCICSFADKYDGKSYNLKTEKYEDCSCMGTLHQLHALIRGEVIGDDEPNVIDDGYRGVEFQSPDYAAINRNIVRKEQREAIDRLFGIGGNS